VWSEKSLAQWDSDIAGIRKMQETCMTTEVIRTGARAALDSGLQDMHRRMMQFIAMAKFHFSDDPVKLGVISATFWLILPHSAFRTDKFFAQLSPWRLDIVQLWGCRLRSEINGPLIGGF
jgi:hypothetical protein